MRLSYRSVATLAAASTLVSLPLSCAHPQNLVQRHPTATGVVAGVATHAALKDSAAYKKAHGENLNFAERHPTLTGIAVGVATHHVIKATTPHH